MKVDINLLPPENRPKPWALLLTILLIVSILAVGYYSYSFRAENAEAKSQVDRLQSQLDTIRSEINSLAKGPAIAEYTQLVAEAQDKLDKLEAVKQDYETWNADKVYWKSVLKTVRELAPDDVTLTEFEQQGDDEITVSGEITGETQSSVIVVEYAKLLEARYIFSQVDLELDTEEQTGEDSETEEIIVFTLLLKVTPGAT